MIGHIIIHRDIIDSEWYQSSNIFRIYIHLIIKANFKDKKWQGQLIRRGQLITSIGHLATELLISVQSTRTAIMKLVESGWIITKPTNRFTLITIVDYDYYQTAKTKSNRQNNIQATSNQHSKNKPTTTTKESNKDNKSIKEIIEVRREIFKKQVFSHTNYKIKVLESFFDYWSEFDTEKAKMRFETERFFEVEKRLKKWLANEKPNISSTKIRPEFQTNR